MDNWPKHWLTRVITKISHILFHEVHETRYVVYCTIFIMEANCFPCILSLSFGFQIPPNLQYYIPQVQCSVVKNYTTQGETVLLRCSHTPPRSGSEIYAVCPTGHLAAVKCSKCGTLNTNRLHVYTFPFVNGDYLMNFPVIRNKTTTNTNIKKMGNWRWQSVSKKFKDARTYIVSTSSFRGV